MKIQTTNPFTLSQSSSQKFKKFKIQIPKKTQTTPIATAVHNTQYQTIQYARTTQNTTSPHDTMVVLRITEQISKEVCRLSDWSKFKLK
jgi:hypothetical protein